VIASVPLPPIASIYRKIEGIPCVLGDNDRSLRDVVC